RMFLSRNKKGTIKVKGKEKDINPMGIYLYKYQNGFWISDGELPVNSYGYKVFHPSWDEENNRLYFASDMPGGYGGTDIYSIKYVNGKWIELKNLGSDINTEANEAFPFIYKSKYLFFASKRKGGKGGFDIYFSLQNDDKFESPVNLGPRFNSRSDDFGLILNDDSNLGYFTSNRPGGIGKDDIYKFVSGKSIFRIFNNYYTLRILDSKKEEPVENARITFSKFKLVPAESPRIEKIKGVEKEIIYTIDPNSLVESKPVYSNEQGEYFLKLKDLSYILKVKKEGYLPYSGLLKATGGNKLIEVKLIPEILDTFQFSFLDSETKNQIKDVNIKMEGGEENNIKYENDNYFIVLLRGEKIDLEVSKDGYVSKKVEIEHGLTPAKFDVVLEKKPKYVKYLPTTKGEVVVLKDIYYDYNSAKLSTKAKKELNKLSIHLKKYPKLKIELSSYTDSRGKKDYNQKLSEKRSANAKKYLIRKGISAKRIVAKGYGESQPKNHCVDGVKCSEKEHAINRRTEVKVIDE
ncbi:MAG TPA: OmpA family protein, partial [Bacteroidetes bacterium]|nr:OmpA family protein [Bacteroidota bacterium]